MSSDPEKLSPADSFERTDITPRQQQHLKPIPQGQVNTVPQSQRPIPQGQINTIPQSQSVAPVISKGTEKRARLSKELHDVLSRDPHFSPHADVVFTPVDRLGMGGMGDVLLVNDKRLGRHAALKLILDSNANSSAVARFQREARVTAALDHPSIPAIYEAGTNSQGQHYMLMPVIRGRELTKVIDDAQESFAKGDWSALPELIEILIKTGEGVAYAHDQGIIHRDLKPSNIMVGTFGEVKVIDWGLAKELYGIANQDDILNEKQIAVSQQELSDLVSDAAQLTRVGVVLGTPCYLAPEQVENIAVGSKADVYSLGAVLTTILTGKPSIEGKNVMASLANTLDGKVVLPVERNSRVPKELNAIAAHALTSNPDDRPTAREFIDNLRAYLTGNDVPLYQYNYRQRIAREAARHPSALILILSLTIIVSISAFMGLKLSESRAQKKAVEENQRNMDKALSFLARAEYLGNRRLLKECDEALQKSLATYSSRSIYWGVAKLYKRFGLFKQAKGILKQSIAKHPKPYREWFLLHLIAMEDKPNVDFYISKPLERLSELTKRNNVDSEFFHFIAAIRAAKEERWQHALEHCDRAIKINENFAAAYHCRGRVYIRLEELKKAVADFALTIKLEPGYASAHVNLGYVYIQLEQFNKARSSLMKAVRLRPNFAIAYNNLGDLYKRQGLFNESIEQCDKALEINPKYASVYLIRAQCYQRLRQHRRAISDFTKALRYKIDRPVRVYHLRGFCYIQLKQYKKACSDYTEVINLAPDEADSFFNRGLLFIKMKNYPRAISDWQETLKLNPIYPQADKMRQRIAAMKARLSKQTDEK
jgi:serine/threonine protein kinase/Tfp pilus assembly protein PilF